MRQLLIFLLMLTLSIHSLAQNNKKPPCTDSVYRQFDFWIGDWEAYGVDGKKKGDSHIDLILDGCIILENWTSTSVINGRTYSGKSYNTFNAASGKWQQYWVDNMGGVTEYFNGHAEDKKLILQTAAVKQPNGTTMMNRMTFFNLGPDEVRQFGENSTDEGKTWTTGFDLDYRRKK